MQTWMVQGAVGLYVASMVGLLTGYMVVAGMEVPAAGWVQGGGAVAPGPNVVRARLDRVKDGRALLPTGPLDVRVADTPVAFGSPKGGVWSGVVELGALAGEAAPVVLSAVLDGEIKLMGAASVAAQPATPEIGPMMSRRQPESQPGEVGVSGASGEVKLEFLPSHGELVRGLPQRLYGRTTDAEGGPLACAVTILKQEGLLGGPALPQTWQTDAMGLGFIEVSPMSDLRMELEAVCGERRGRAVWYMTSVPAQLAMRMDSYAVAPGSTARGVVKTVARQGTLWVEVADGDAWRWAGAWQMGEWESALGVRIPASAREGQLLQVQASQDMLDAGLGWEMRYVVVARDVDAALTAVGALMVERDAARWRAWVAAMEARRGLASAAEKERWLEVMLGELPPRYVKPRVWLHTLEADQAALDGWKAKMRGRLFGLVVAGMGLGLVWLLVAVSKLASARRARLKEFETSLIAEGEEAESLTAGGDTMSARVQMALVIGTLGLFGACMLMLLKLL
jgi:hypothetical protein